MDLRDTRCTEGKSLSGSEGHSVEGKPRGTLSGSEGHSVHGGKVTQWI